MTAAAWAPLAGWEARAGQRSIDAPDGRKQTQRGSHAHVGWYSHREAGQATVGAPIKQAGSPILTHPEPPDIAQALILGKDGVMAWQRKA